MNEFCILSTSHRLYTCSSAVFHFDTDMHCPNIYAMYDIFFHDVQKYYRSNQQLIHSIRKKYFIEIILKCLSYIINITMPTHRFNVQCQQYVSGEVAKHHHSVSCLQMNVFRGGGVQAPNYYYMYS